MERPIPPMNWLALLLYALFSFVPALLLGALVSIWSHDAGIIVFGAVFTFMLLGLVEARKNLYLNKR